MRDLWLGGVYIILIISGVEIFAADEFAGKLQRVDWETVTLLDIDNNSLVVRVDTQIRQEAAHYLGKTVTVDFLNEDGGCRAIRFRSSR